MLLGVEPELDTHDPAAGAGGDEGCGARGRDVPRTSIGATEYAHVLLPIAPFTETSGTFVSTEGTVQSFNGVVQPLGETRPAWKVLRVLGNLLGLAGFDYDSCGRGAARGARRGRRRRGEARRTALRRGRPLAGPAARSGELERIGEVPIYAADAIVRRARSLQATR